MKISTYDLAKKVNVELTNKIKMRNNVRYNHNDTAQDCEKFLTQPRTQRKPRILFILSRIMGNKTFSNQVAKVACGLGFIEPTFLFIDDEDYRKYNIPRILQKSCLLESTLVARTKYKDVMHSDFDILFIQSMALIPPFMSLVRRYPTILAHDSTYLLSARLDKNWRSGFVSNIQYSIKKTLFTPLYKNILRCVDVFLPRTEMVARSLIEDYQISVDKIIVTPCCFDLDVWRPHEPKSNEKPVLLFVTNNFSLKGGEFLLDMYTGHLSGVSRLRIITNDPRVKQMHFPLGVEVYMGVSHENEDRLIELYQTSDIMLHPTKKDFLPIVLVEACSVGLPIIANNVGAICEIVKEGYNGHLMQASSSPKEWAEVVLSLVMNKERRREFSRHSREIAERKFSVRRFESNIVTALNKIFFRYFQ